MNIPVLCPDPAIVQAVAQLSVTDPETAFSEIVVTGSRLARRTTIDSPVPIDVLSGDALIATGAFEPRPEYGAETTPHLEVGFAVTDKIDWNVSVFGPFDQYPDRSSADISIFGNLLYDILSPVGVNGRYLYTRATARF